MFLAHCVHVDDSKSAMEFVAKISKQYADATHNCYAFVASDGSRYSDDGEPQGTAGMPIREVIIKSKLSDVCVVVTRYFGGIKLGAGGLIRAYSNAASQVLASAKKVVLRHCTVVQINAKYTFAKSITAVIEQFGKILSTSYDTGAIFSAAIDSGKLGILEEKLKEICRGDLVFDILCEQMTELF